MTYEESRSPVGLIVAGVIAFFAVIIAITVLFGSWYTIDQRERGVILRNGKLVGTALPGLNFKWPMIDSVVKISLETQRAKYEKLNSYSRDQQPADIWASVNFRVAEDKVDDLYIQYGGVGGYIDRVIAPRVFSDLKIVFGQFNAITAVQERGRLNLAFFDAMKAAGGNLVTIESVQIENIDFSNEYEKSIEQRMLAEVEVQRLRQNAEREKVQAEIVVTKATAEANAVRQRALAESEAIKLRGDAEAFAIQARGKALGENPHLVTLVQAERWNGVLPVTMIPGGSVPMLAIGK